MDSTAATQAAGVAYGAGRYGNGLVVKDTTRVAWAVSIPAVFHTTFWYAPAERTTCIVWMVTGSTGLLAVGYDAATSSFFLEDQLSHRVNVPFDLTVMDRICLGVCQTASERRLFVGLMGSDGDVESSSAAFAPVGSFTNLRLY